jgi:hypothetical protein
MCSGYGGRLPGGVYSYSMAELVNLVDWLPLSVGSFDTFAQFLR